VRSMYLAWTVIHLNIIFTVYPYAQPNRIYRLDEMEAFFAGAWEGFEGVEFFWGKFYYTA
jgi:hypothetical protein